MADVSIFNLVAGTTLASADVLPFVDVSDSSQSPQGSTLKITMANFFATVPSPVNVTSSSANALAVGRQGTTDPVLQVDASTASVATGLKIKGAAAAAGVAVSVISSGTNENLTLDAKGSGTITIAGTSTVAVWFGRAVAITSTSALAFAVGRQGTSGPAFSVNASTALQATGFGIIGYAAGNGVDIAATSSGTNESIRIDAKGTGTVSIATLSTGTVTVGTPLSVVTATFEGIKFTCTGATDPAFQFTHQDGGGHGWLATENASTGTSVLWVGAHGIVAFGGYTSSFPAIKRSSTTLEVKLADDSAYAPLRSSLISVGTNPASAGSVRIPNNSGVLARNAANSSDFNLIFLNASDKVVIDNTQAGTIFGAGIALSGGTAPSNGIQFGTSAPGSLANGQMWYDGTDFKVRTGGVTRTITVT